MHHSQKGKRRGGGRGGRDPSARLSFPPYPHKASTHFVIKSLYFMGKYIYFMKNPVYLGGKVCMLYENICIFYGKLYINVYFLLESLNFVRKPGYLIEKSICSTEKFVRFAESLYIY